MNNLNKQKTNSNILKAIKEQALYTFFTEEQLDKLWRNETIEHTTINKEGEKSERSLMYSKDFLINRYICNKEFKEKYKESFEGSSYGRFAAIHSSSLFAFLFFSLVNENNKLEINTPQLKGVHFTNVVFEHKNIVFKDHNNLPASQIDVVLIGKDQKDHDVILFLESKFSEYLNRNSKKEYSPKYKDILEKYLKNLGYSIFLGKNKNGECKTLLKGEKPQYLDGIKQMIHHYEGLKNFTDRNFYNKQNKEIEEMYVRNPDCKIYFGIILFDFNMKRTNNKLLEYKQAYSQLIKFMNDNEKVTMLDDVLIYQDLIKGLDSKYFDELDDIFKKMYKIEK